MIMFNKMELTEGAHVYTANGEQVGKISRFVLDPATDQVTHIIVQKGWIAPTEKVIELKMVTSAMEDKVYLNSEIDGFDHLPPFEEKHFIRTSPEDMRHAGYPDDKSFPAYYWYPPQGYVGYPTFILEPQPWVSSETKRNIPEETVPLKDGSQIISADGEHVGNIERLLVESGLNRATHLIMKHGILFKEHTLIPTHWVASVVEDKVYLTVSAHLIRSLPPYDV
jgi:uncharacterized protein YrrD